MGQVISSRRLAWLVRARGTDLASWPSADRAAALELLRRSPEAQSMFAEALAHEDDPAEPDRAVLERMLSAVRRRLAPLPMLLRAVCVGALVACGAAGLYLAALTDADAAGDLFGTAQTVSVAALDQ